MRNNLNNLARVFASASIGIPLLVSFMLMTLEPTLGPAIAADQTAVQVQIVNAGPEPELGTQTIRLKELWRAGGDDDEVFFGNILQVVGGPNGKIYALDVQLVQIFVFAANGEYLGTLGARGEGPGEVSNSNCMIPMRDGGVGLGQVIPGKLAMIRANGDPGPILRITDPAEPEGGLVLLMEGRAGHSQLTLAGMRWSFSEQGMLVQNMFLRGYGMDGIPGMEFFGKQSEFNAAHFEFDELKYDFPWRRFCVLADGRVCFAPERNKYEINICRSDGSVERIIRRPYRSVVRNAEQKEQARLTTEAIGSHYGRELRGVTIEDTEPDILDLWSNPEGHLWVRTSEGDASPDAGVLTVVDVLSPEGKFVSQRKLVCPGNPMYDGIHFLPGRKVMVVLGAMDAYRREVDSTTSESQGAAETVHELICYGVE
ncbi:MAG: 6-bladed beta-propeller [Gemmatimonadales bacterium]|nr:6-bladed beta-propeller [Gemmatimonadales bacterium]